MSEMFNKSELNKVREWFGKKRLGFLLEMRVSKYTGIPKENIRQYLVELVSGREITNPGGSLFVYPTKYHGYGRNGWGESDPNKAPCFGMSSIRKDGDSVLGKYR